MSHMECDRCEGEGEIGVKCDRCDGMGRVTERCIPCDGTGFNEAREPCFHCFEGGDGGRGNVTIGCPDCGGQGDGEGDDIGDGMLSEKCSRCGGHGSID